MTRASVKKANYTSTRRCGAKVGGLVQKLREMENSPKISALLQFIRFGIVGASNTLIALAVYWLCFYGLHLHYQLANLASFVVSVTNAYYWNNRFVFRNGAMSASQHLRAYGKAFTSYGGTYLLGVGLLFVWVELLGVSEGIAPLINLLITIPLNFLLNKYWAFRQR